VLIHSAIGAVFAKGGHPIGPVASGETPTSRSWTEEGKKDWRNSDSRLVLAYGTAICTAFLSRRPETLLVLPSLGVQVKTQYCLGHQTTQFFDRSCVKGIVINEAVTMHSWPRLKDLVQVYQAVQAMTPSVGTKQSAGASERTDSQSWGDSDHANSFIGVKARRKHSAERAENATSTAKN
ncbi:hypothetical protein BaRGS_00001739, partial [Batillaria attramentaria]